jgi:hypothetical protein
MKLTPTQIKVLQYAQRNIGKIQRSALANYLWPNHHSQHLNGHAKAAGSLLGKYYRMGLLTNSDKPTAQALVALRAAQPLHQADAASAVSDSH